MWLVMFALLALFYPQNKPKTQMWVYFGLLPDLLWSYLLLLMLCHSVEILWLGLISPHIVPKIFISTFLIPSCFSILQPPIIQLLSVRFFQPHFIAFHISQCPMASLLSYVYISSIPNHLLTHWLEYTGLFKHGPNRQKSQLTSYILLD